VEFTLPSGGAAWITRSEGADRGLVVLPDIWGLRPLFTEMCDGLASRTGWSVGCLEPFPGRELPGEQDADGATVRFAEMSRLDDARLLGDAVALADELGPERVGLVGFCMGGMYAFKASATGRFDRVAAFYGMARVPADWVGPGQGEPLDALARRAGTGVMAIVGSVDPYTPPDDVQDLRDAGVEVVSYEGAEHGFVHDPSRPTHRAADAADAWNRVLVFLAGRQ